MLRIVLSLFCELYLFLVLGLDSKGITNTLKRYYVAMECAGVVAFTFKIVFTLQVDFAMPEATVMNLFGFARISCGLRQMK